MGLTQGSTSLGSWVHNNPVCDSSFIHRSALHNAWLIAGVLEMLALALIITTTHLRTISSSLKLSKRYVSREGLPQATNAMRTPPIHFFVVYYYFCPSMLLLLPSTMAQDVEADPPWKENSWVMTGYTQRTFHSLQTGQKGGISFSRNWTLNSWHQCSATFKQAGWSWEEFLTQKKMCSVQLSPSGNF